MNTWGLNVESEQNTSDQNAITWLKPSSRTVKCDM